MGLPTFWKALFIAVSGVLLVFSSITLSIPKKPTKHRVKKEKIDDVHIESIPIYPKDNIMPDIVIKEKTRKSKVVLEKNER